MTVNQPVEVVFKADNAIEAVFKMNQPIEVTMESK